MLYLNQAVSEKKYIFDSIEGFEKEERQLARLGLVKGKMVMLVAMEKDGKAILSVQGNKLALDQKIVSAIRLLEKNEEEHQTFSLADGAVGEKYCVRKVLGSGAVHRRLMDMGLTKNTVVTLRKKAPLGDPIEINLRNYELTLRKEEAELVSVQEWEA